ncbi:MAG: class I SAM-dependent methyltransferase [Pseudomonadota bacterium]|nr:class I SAM-dependent methyltransferase [Pseudomonadota bacterium]
MNRLRTIVARLGAAWRIAQVKAFAMRLQSCPMCGPSLLLRLADTEMGVRCLRCAASPVHMSLASVVLNECPHLARSTVYELSSRGAWVEYLKRKVLALTLSEYMEDLAGTELDDSVRCENVERLSFAAERFDLVTCSDVFEHVADDRAGFAEVLRVLKPGGAFVFTVPLGTEAAVTVERARRAVDGSIVHLLPPEYHCDHLRGVRRVLSFRDYAGDLPQRLRSVGFDAARIVRQPADRWWGWARAVIVARKPELIQ